MPTALWRLWLLIDVPRERRESDIADIESGVAYAHREQAHVDKRNESYERFILGRPSAGVSLMSIDYCNVLSEHLCPDV